MELYVWPRKWGMVSFDPECLSVLAYLRFGSSPVHIKVVNSSWYSPCGVLPCLEHSTNQIYNLSNIFNYLRKENYGIEYDLQDTEVISMKALIHSLERYLIPGLEHFWWINTSSFTKIIRASYGASIGLPFSLFWPSRMRAKYQKKLLNLHLYNHEKVDEKEIKNVLYQNTMRCMTALSNMINDQEFIIANRPTAVDAIIFGRLWPLLNAPVDNKDHIVVHLGQCDNLKRYLINIGDRYFSDVNPHGSFRNTVPPRFASSSGDKDTGNNSKSNANTDSEKTLRNTLLFLGAAFGVSLIYAVVHGIVDINVESLRQFFNPAPKQSSLRMTASAKDYLIKPSEESE